MNLQVAPARRLKSPFILLVGGLAIACASEVPPPLPSVPIFPGASLRLEESAFQQRLLAILSPAGRAGRRVEVYETPSAFTAVVEFYEPYVVSGKLNVRGFAVSSRMRRLADGARRGAAQMLAVGRLLFSGAPGPAGGADSLPSGGSLSAPAIADSLTALADRLAEVQGLFALGEVRLAGSRPSAALISIERPHFDPSTLRVDSLTIISITIQPTPGLTARRKP